jgi:hypothetical protein
MKDYRAGYFRQITGYPQNFQPGMGSYSQLIVIGTQFQEGPR